MIRTTHNRIYYLIKGKDLRNAYSRYWFPLMTFTVFYFLFIYFVSTQGKTRTIAFLYWPCKRFHEIISLCFCQILSTRCIWFVLWLNKDMNLTVWYFKTTLIFVILRFHTYNPRLLTRIRTKQLMSSSIRSPAPQK